MSKIIDVTFTNMADKYNCILREKSIGRIVKVQFFFIHLARFKAT